MRVKTIKYTSRQIFASVNDLSTDLSYDHLSDDKMRRRNLSLLRSQLSREFEVIIHRFFTKMATSLLRNNKQNFVKIDTTRGDHVTPRVVFSANKGSNFTFPLKVPLR